MSPEVLNESKYNNKTDVWSLGVLIYLLAYGTVPFEAQNVQQLYQLIIEGDFKFPKDETFGNDLKDLIQSML